MYPLTSKLPAFKKFRKHLAEFIDRLVSASAELGLLYSTDLIATLQTWVVAMSSSQIRSFRHTATVIALELETALCDVAAAVEKEAEVASRQREGEKKRKATNKSAGAARLKELNLKAKDVRKRRDQVSEFLKEFVDGCVWGLCRVTRTDKGYLSAACSFTAIVIWIPTSARNVFALSESGSKSTLATSSTPHTSVTSVGSSPMPLTMYGSKPCAPFPTCMTKPILSALSTTLRSGSSRA